MKHIKLFDALNDANNFEIKNIPFVCAVKNNGDIQSVQCNKEGGKLVVNGDKVDVAFVTMLTLYVSDPYNFSDNYPNPNDQETPGFAVQYVEGMTWGEWYNSSYSDLVQGNGITVKDVYSMDHYEDSHIGNGVHAICTYPDYTRVRANQIIDATKEYCVDDD